MSSILNSFIDREDFKQPLVSHLMVYLSLKGDHSTSLRKLSEATGISLQSTRTALNQLEKQGDIATARTRMCTVITHLKHVGI